MYCILLARQTYHVHTNETRELLDQQRKESKSSFPLFLLFSKLRGWGEVGVRRLQGETNPAGRPKPEYLLLCSRFCLHADGLRRKRPPPTSNPPLAKHWPVPKNFQPVGFVSPSDRKLSPPPLPLLSSSTPPSAEVGVLREHREYRC